MRTEFDRDHAHRAGLLPVLLGGAGSETMNADEQRRLENQLMVMGLNKLEDPALVPAMAALINHGYRLMGHDFFLGLINECEQERRYEMYEALKPHLKFKPWPLEKYISVLKEHAGNVASTWAPTEIGEKKSAQPIKFNGHEFEEVAPDDAEGCLLTLTCYKCTRKADFHGITPVQAVMVARHDGWVRDLVMQKEICPKCPAIRPRTARA
jgi:hypothetical protein